MQKLLSRLRRAVVDFDLIQAGDKIAVGLSGGKDSITLLYLLNAYKRFSPEPFELIAITLDPGTGADFSEMIRICKELNVPYYLFKTRIKEIVFDIRKESNPCSLCANLRRGSLNDHAKKLGCNKIALGHHKNDAIETLLMSMFYEGRINTFLPDTYLSRANLHIIRPMVYIDEQNIKAFIKNSNIPIVENPCPANGFTKREYMKNLTYSLENDIPGLKNNLLNSLSNIEQLNIWHKKNK
ncbi:tRNA 2-thiocytidine(32) synthetase TtcA [Clostridium botulinum]|uniref:ATPase n=1 Tax=Clostridium botulinum C/D str. DC5 TaxID=1443128 RepID=A0A0A0IIH5_CLOBO|nr:ATP-binding protein [Clostridium botulinum]KEI00292.1 ATPase [Clostridium botulinum C/D str. BKT75002]KEI08913.1 ATPase [Clostridium botulinum C/D str. BKT2873]KGM99385.1 ATPase [Clostridium botulinum C/D str. DC5]KOC55324.1 ATPase [Clostridium botulinum]KOC57109.1 ATPase [Clostridium botulinum]